MPTVDITLLTESRYLNPENPDWYAQQILDDDALLIAALQKRGLRAVRADWADGDVDWSATRMAVFRTTWNYFHRFSEFSRWLDRVEKQTTLVNAPELIRWNWDKHYLNDLSRSGIPIPETRFIEAGTETTLAKLHAETGWTETVLKPAISGGGRHTYRLDAENLPEHEAVFKELIAQEAMLLQPFQHQVVSKGELSLMVIGGRYTHAVIKTAKAGDYRVQDDFGGTARPHEASPEEIALAERTVAACRQAPAYARVDIIHDNHGRLAVSELELIEPELWLRHHPPAAELMADAIVSKLP